MKVYTKKGDKGATRLLFGMRVSKTDPRCEAYGSTDTAVSAMGLARALCNDQRVKEILLIVQRQMFTVGSELATDRTKWSDLKAKYAVVTADMVAELEGYIDELDVQIDLPPAFIVPGARALPEPALRPAVHTGALRRPRVPLRAHHRRRMTEGSTLTFLLSLDGRGERASRPRPLLAQSPLELRPSTPSLGRVGTPNMVRYL